MNSIDFEHVYKIAADGRTKEVLRHIKKGWIKVNEKNKDGWTLLHQACHLDNSELVVELLKVDADYYVTDWWGELPFHYASKETLGKVYLYYYSKGEIELAEKLQEKYNIKIEDIL